MNKETNCENCKWYCLYNGWNMCVRNPKWQDIGDFKRHFCGKFDGVKEEWIELAKERFTNTGRSKTPNPNIKDMKKKNQLKNISFKKLKELDKKYPNKISKI